MSEHILLTQQMGAVLVLTLNRLQALNALSSDLVAAIAEALAAADKDASVKIAVLTGSAKAFAAGADIAEMANMGFAQAYEQNLLAGFEAIGRFRKPLIAAVSGFALGGGCELALLCDFILAAENAKFGQPEIKLGVIPGAGGTQRFARAAGKAKTMEMVLTGRMMDATEAERCGIVARIVPTETYLEDAIATAQTIAQFSPIALKAAKEAVNAAFETPLAQGVHFERRLFQALFDTDDKKEGMDAFLAKRPANFKGQ